AAGRHPWRGRHLAARQAGTCVQRSPRPHRRGVPRCADGPVRGARARVQTARPHRRAEQRRDDDRPAVRVPRAAAHDAGPAAAHDAAGRRWRAHGSTTSASRAGRRRRRGAPPEQRGATMIDAQQARATATEALGQLEQELGVPLALWEGDPEVEPVADHGDVWVVSWNSVEYLQTRDFYKQQLVGPIAIPKGGSDWLA